MDDYVELLSYKILSLLRAENLIGLQENSGEGVNRSIIAFDSSPTIIGSQVRATWAFERADLAMILRVRDIGVNEEAAAAWVVKVLNPVSEIPLEVQPITLLTRGSV